MYHRSDWGKGTGTIAFGEDVLPQLINGINDWLDRPGGPPGKTDPMRIALGAVYSVSDPDVVTALLRIPHLCLVVDKSRSHYRETGRLARHPGGPHTCVVPGLFGVGRTASGEPLEYHSEFGVGEEEGLLDAVRVWGHAGDGRNPYMHAKLLVLGHAYWPEIEGCTLAEPMWHPSRVWMGSANWSQNARGSYEWGSWSTDRDLNEAMRRFVTDIIRRSEPLGSPHPEPTTDLGVVDWPEPDADDIQEMRWAQEERDAEEDEDFEEP